MALRRVKGPWTLGKGWENLARLCRDDCGQGSFILSVSCDHLFHGLWCSVLRLVFVLLPVEYSPSLGCPRCWQNTGCLVYLSIGATSACFTIFREYRLCFPSIYPCLCFAHPLLFLQLIMWLLDTEGDLHAASHAEQDYRDSLWITNTVHSFSLVFLSFTYNTEYTIKLPHTLVMCLSYYYRLTVCISTQNGCCSVGKIPVLYLQTPHFSFSSSFYLLSSSASNISSLIWKVIVLCRHSATYCLLPKGYIHTQHMI